MRQLRTGCRATSSGLAMNSCAHAAPDIFVSVERNFDRCARSATQVKGDRLMRNRPRVPVGPVKAPRASAQPNRPRRCGAPSALSRLRSGEWHDHRRHSPLRNRRFARLSAGEDWIRTRGSARVQALEPAHKCCSISSLTRAGASASGRWPHLGSITSVASGTARASSSAFAAAGVTRSSSPWIRNRASSARRRAAAFRHPLGSARPT